MEYELHPKCARTKLLPLVVNGVAQPLYMEGYRRSDGGGPAGAWRCWPRTGSMPARARLGDEFRNPDVGRRLDFGPLGQPAETLMHHGLHQEQARLGLQATLAAYHHDRL